MEHYEEFKKLRNHAYDSRKKKWCIQCQYPWYDGTCSCGNFEDSSVQLSNKIATELIIKYGWNGDITFKRFSK